MAVSASDTNELPADAPHIATGSEHTKTNEDLSVSEGLTWSQKLIGIVAVVAVCYGFVKYNSNKPSHNLGYEKTRA